MDKSPRMATTDSFSMFRFFSTTRQFPNDRDHLVGKFHHDEGAGNGKEEDCIHRDIGGHAGR